MQISLWLREEGKKAIISHYFFFSKKEKCHFYAIKLEKESKWDVAKTKFAEDKQNKKIWFIFKS